MIEQNEDEEAEFSTVEQLFESLKKFEELAAAFENDSKLWTKRFKNELQSTIKQKMLESIGTEDRINELMGILKNFNTRRTVSEDIGDLVSDEMLLQRDILRVNSMIDSAKRDDVKRIDRLYASYQSLKRAQHEIIEESIENLKESSGLNRNIVKSAEMDSQIARLKSSLVDKKYLWNLRKADVDLSIEELRHKYEQNTEEQVRNLMGILDRKSKAKEEEEKKIKRWKNLKDETSNNLSLLLHELEKEQNQFLLSISKSKDQGDDENGIKIANPNSIDEDFIELPDGGMITEQMLDAATIQLDKAEDEAEALTDRNILAEERVNKLRDDLSQLLASEANIAVEKLKKMSSALETKITTDKERLSRLEIITEQIIKEDRNPELTKELDRKKKSKRKNKNGLKLDSIDGLDTTQSIAEESSDGSDDLPEKSLKNLKNSGDIRKVLYRRVFDKYRDSQVRSGKDDSSFEYTSSENDHSSMDEKKMNNDEKKKKEEKNERITVNAKQRNNRLNSSFDNSQQENRLTTRNKTKYGKEKEKDLEKGKLTVEKEKGKKKRRGFRRVIATHQRGQLEKMLESFEQTAKTLTFDRRPIFQYQLSADSVFTDPNSQNGKDLQPPGSAGKKKSRPLNTVSHSFDSISTKKDPITGGIKYVSNAPTSKRRSSSFVIDDFSDPGSAQNPAGSEFHSSSFLLDEDGRVGTAGSKYNRKNTVENEKKKENGKGNNSNVNNDYLYVSELQHEQNQEFYMQNFGFKIALNQLHTLFYELSNWNKAKKEAETEGKIENKIESRRGSKSQSDGNEIDMVGSKKVRFRPKQQSEKDALFDQEDKDESHSVQELRRGTERFMRLIRELYYNSKNFEKVLHQKEALVTEKLKECDQLRAKLLHEVEGARWPSSTQAGQIQQEIAACRNRIKSLKQQLKELDKKVTSHRANNLKLAQLLHGGNNFVNNHGTRADPSSHQQGLEPTSGGDPNSPNSMIRRRGAHQNSRHNHIRRGANTPNTPEEMNRIYNESMRQLKAESVAPAPGLPLTTLAGVPATISSGDERKYSLSKKIELVDFHLEKEQKEVSGRSLRGSKLEKTETSLESNNIRRNSASKRHSVSRRKSSVSGGHRMTPPAVVPSPARERPSDSEEDTEDEKPKKNVSFVPQSLVKQADGIVNKNLE